MSYFSRKIVILFLVMSSGFVAESFAMVSDSQENTCTALVPYQDPREVIEDSIQRGQDALMDRCIREYYANDSLSSWLHDMQTVEFSEKVSPKILCMIIDLIIHKNKAKSWPNVYDTVREIMGLRLINKEFDRAIQTILNEVSPVDVSLNAKMICYILGYKEACKYAIIKGKVDLVQELIEIKEYEYQKNPIQLAYWMIQDFDSVLMSSGSFYIIAKNRETVAQVLINVIRSTCPDDATFLEVANSPNDKNVTLLMSALWDGNIAFVKKICAAMKNVYAGRPDELVNEICRVSVDTLYVRSALVSHTFTNKVDIIQEIISMVKEICGNEGVLQVISFSIQDGLFLRSACSQIVSDHRKVGQLEYFLSEVLEASRSNFQVFVNTVDVNRILHRAIVYCNREAVRMICDKLEQMCNGDYQLIINVICPANQDQNGLFARPQDLLLGDIARMMYGDRFEFRYLESFVQEMRRRTR